MPVNETTTQFSSDDIIFLVSLQNILDKLNNNTILLSNRIEILQDRIQENSNYIVDRKLLKILNKLLENKIINFLDKHYLWGVGIRNHIDNIVSEELRMINLILENSIKTMDSILNEINKLDEIFNSCIEELRLITPQNADLLVLNNVFSDIISRSHKVAKNSFSYLSYMLTEQKEIINNLHTLYSKLDKTSYHDIVIALERFEKEQKVLKNKADGLKGYSEEMDETLLKLEKDLIEGILPILVKNKLEPLGEIYSNMIYS